MLAIVITSAGPLAIRKLNENDTPKYIQVQSGRGVSNSRHLMIIIYIIYIICI